MTDNSFLHPLGQVAFGSYRPQDVDEAMARAEGLALDRVTAILAVPAGERTFENTVLALAEATEEASTVRGLVQHLAKVCGGPWHPVNERAAQKMTALTNQLRFFRPAYDALLEVRDRPGYMESLSPARQKYLEELVLQYERDGIAVPADEQAELRKIVEQISAAEVAFTRNLMEATDAAGTHVAGPEDLEGLSDEFLAKARSAAEAKGLDGYWLAYNYPDYRYVMANCRVRATRQAFYRVNVSLAAGANLAVAQQLLGLRRRMANQLGYTDYADYALQLRMAKDGATAAAFVARLTALYGPGAAAEHQELAQFARLYEEDRGFEVDASEVGVDVYHAAKLRAAQVGLEEEELRDYFPLCHVKQVMFSTLSDLYGFEFRPVALPAWHEDVETYEIWDGDAHLSTVWCDWYARPGKVPGAWADAFYIAARNGGQVAEPTLGSVTCNFPAPDGSGHCRLSLRDVETLWHEFGHFVHITSNMTELRQQCSFACRWDFIEAPSQIMENWVWQEDILSEMASHYATGESLPEDVQARLLASRRFRVATAAMRQLAFAAEDLALHRQYGGASEAELLAFHRRVRQPYLPVPMYPEDAMLASFHHIFGGAYAAAYYSYKWAEAIEADLFSVFKPGRARDREAGTRYRRLVLARGAEVEPDQLVRDFLGRDATPEAMLERDGLLPAAGMAGSPGKPT